MLNITNILNGPLLSVVLLSNANMAFSDNNKRPDLVIRSNTSSTVMVLSPIKGINKQEQGKGIGYLEKTYQNLAAIKEGLQCKN